MEEIIAVAYKSENGRIYLGRNDHTDIKAWWLDLKNEGTLGFITSLNRFVDRKEALQIAQKNNKNFHKISNNDELYSEDLFVSEMHLVEKIRKLEEEIKELRGL